MQTLLEVKDISKKYKLLKDKSENSNVKENFIVALSNISFNINKGESLGIVGKNGSGKSTLLKILSGMIKPDNGIVKIYGTIAAILDIGFGMIPEFTGYENIYFIGTLGGYRRSEVRKLIDEIVDFADIGEFIDQPLKTYSNGMYLRLAFAIKTIISTDLLILDEVIAVGDIKFQEKCIHKIKNLQREGKSLIIVSHNLKEIADYTNHSILLEKGEMINSGTTIDIINQYESISGLNERKANPAINFALDPDHCITVLDYNLSSYNIKMGEKISTSISIKINIEGNYNIMLFVSDFRGIIFSDSFSYRTFPQFSIDQAAIYICTGEIQPNFFNKGKFYVGYAISDTKITLYENLRCMSFDVFLNDGVHISPWSVYDKNYPLRPELKWDLSVKKK